MDTEDVKVNKKLNVKGFCTDLAYDLVGSVLYAAGIVCFVNPANMAPGGMSGVAILLNYLWGLPIGTMTIVLNIPLLILSYIFLGKSLTWKTVKSLVISSLMVDLVMAKYAPGGYLKLWFPEGKNAEQLKKLQAIIADEGQLRQVFNRIFEEEK